MKKLNLTLIAILTLGLTFTSCKKDDSPEPTTQQKVEPKKEDPKPTLTDLLVNKNWVITGAILEEPLDLGDGNLITDIYEFVEECGKDDITIFKIDGKGLVKVGEKCTESEEDSDFLWYINPDDENEIWSDSEGEVTIYKVIEMSDDKAIMQVEAETLGEPLIVNLHMKAV